MVTKITSRRGVTLIEILVASIGAFGVLAGLAGLYTLALTLYKSSVMQDQRLASSGLVEDLMTQVTATCPTDRWLVATSPTMGQDNRPQWRALCYERLSNHNIRHPPNGPAPFALQRPFDAFPGGTYYPRNQNSVMDRDTGVIFWWRDLNTWHAGQGRYLESKIFHMRVPIQRRDQPLSITNPNNVLGNVFGQPRTSFSDMSVAELGAFFTDIRNRRAAEVIAEDVREFHLQTFGPPPPAAPDGIYWRYDAFRGT